MSSWQKGWCAPKSLLASRLALVPKNGLIAKRRKAWDSSKHGNGQVNMEPQRGSALKQRLLWHHHWKALIKIFPNKPSLGENMKENGIHHWEVRSTEFHSRKKHHNWKSDCETFENHPLIPWQIWVEGAIIGSTRFLVEGPVEGQYQEPNMALG